MSRIVYVSTDAGVPVFGRKGSSVHVQAVLTHLVELGHQVHLITPRLGGPVPAPLAAVRVHRLPRLSGAGSPTAARQALDRVAEAEVAPVLNRIAGGGRIDLVYERYALWGRTATAWARAHAVPSVLEVNAPLPVEQQRHRELADRAAADAVARAACGTAGVVVCVTDEVAAWVRSLGTRRPVRTVANGVDTRRFAPRPADGIRSPGEDFTVGFIGTLKPWHGVEVLVEAFAALSAAEAGYRLLVVGDGPRRDALGRQVAALGLVDRVEFTGAVDPARVPGLLGRMDLAVAPYPDLDGFYFSPLKIYEYLAAGVPVLATAVGQLPALLAPPGRPDLGALCAPGSRHHLAAAVAALRHDPGRRAALSTRGRAAAVADHDWAMVVDRILRLAATSHRTEPDVPKAS